MSESYGGDMEIVALVEDRLEQVTHLASTDREVLFVMSDRLAGADVKALQAWKKRLAGEGRRPFLVLSCHRQGETLGPKGLFDMTAICGREKDLSLSLPAETVAAMLGGELPVERGELLRPGRLVCFTHSAAWTGEPKEAVDKLCSALRQEVAAARDGSATRLAFCVTAPGEVELEYVLQCGNVLTGEGAVSGSILFQMELTDNAPGRSITVRGLVGEQEPPCRIPAQN